MVNDIINTIRSFSYGKLILFKIKAGFVTSYDKDLYQAAILLKNLSLVRKDYPMSADYMMEEITGCAGNLKPVFQEMLSIYRSGRPEEAFNFFDKAVGSKNGTNFAMILSKLEKINPAELVTRLDIFINLVRESRKTQAVRQTEKNSLILTALSTACVLSLLVNFCVVIVFMDTLNTLSNIF